MFVNKYLYYCDKVICNLSQGNKSSFFLGGGGELGKVLDGDVMSPSVCVCHPQ